ncbi:nucleotide exchange factor GrpE [Colidextribacter sp. OB.20]|uniref:nucleotide exchange factor GrpE n=1 Tax=Colidextribacter sp. OB.20 TaxID=2304568 RepID=UPI001371124B|nr:nucleotide exchange factor GrpE [Colidextribacter sp. OB.20]
MNAVSKKKEKKEVPVQETPDQVLEEQAETAEAVREAESQADTPGPEPEEPAVEEEPVVEPMVPKEQFLRLAAEYDNYRKRTAKEKEGLWADAKADTVQAFLPVYDNLERALKQETADEAYKKGVEMIMNQLKEIFAKLGITEIDAQGKPFDPNLHNAVMHIEDENLEENVVAQVFQAGFMLGEKVIRFAMVQVAN